MSSNYKDIIIGILSLIAATIILFIISGEIDRLSQSPSKIVPANDESVIDVSKADSSPIKTTNENNNNKVISTYDLCVEKSKPYRDMYFINENECRPLNENNDFYTISNLNASFDEMRDFYKNTASYTKIEERERFIVKYNKFYKENFSLIEDKTVSVIINNIYGDDGLYYINLASNFFIRYPECDSDYDETDYKDYWGATITTECVNGEIVTKTDFPFRKYLLSPDVKIFLRSDDFQYLNLYSLKPGLDINFLNDYFSNSSFLRNYSVEIVDGKVTKIIENYQQ